MKNLKFIFGFFIPLAIFVGCMSDSTNTPKQPVLKKVWEVSGLKAPESAMHDSKTNIIYVSNVNGNPLEKNGLGFISKISADGKIQNLKWVTGLNAPKGMAVFSNTLYVSDLDQLVEINVETGDITRRHPVANAKFLNDVAVDNKGIVYMSDMFDNAIYRLTDERLKLWIQDASLKFPNGIYVDRDQLIIASWGVITDPKTFGTKVPGSIYTISLSTKNIKNLTGEKPVGNLDGIEKVTEGNFLVSDNIKGEILHVQTSGKASILLKVEPSCGDIGYIRKSRTLLIPFFNQGKLTAYSYMD